MNEDPTNGWPDDLKARWEFHEARLNSMEDQLSRQIEASATAREDLDTVIASIRQMDSYLARAFRLGVKEARRERVRRQSLRREMLDWQRQWRRRQEEADERLTRIERIVERRFNSPNGGPNGAD